MVDISAIICALGSAIFNGSFGALSKIQAVRETNVSPFVFNLYSSVGVFLTSWIGLASGPFAWIDYGLLSGFLFVAANGFAYITIERIGLSIGTGIWCGVAIVVSFIFGAIYDVKPNQMRSFEASCTAIVVLVLVVCCMAWILQQVEKERKDREETTSLLHKSDFVLPEKMNENFLLGVTTAILTGLFGGLILAPTKFINDKDSGLTFLPSFGIGALVFSPIPPLLYALFLEKPKKSESSWVAVIAGIASGMLWNFGNLCSLIALGKLGFPVAMPIMQCGLFVASAWGIFVFKEIKGKWAERLLLCGLVLICAAVILGMYGQKK